MKKILLLSLAVMLLCWGFAYAANSGVTNAKIDASLSVAKTANGSTQLVAKQATTNVGAEASVVKPEPVSAKIAQAADPSITSNVEVLPNHEIVKGSAVTPPAPDQRVILQGGDDFATATPITALPYSDAGTTTGYTHNYTLTCISNATSPDVVYSYAPTADGTINASLCGSSYDTGIGVYEDNSSTQIACNDDFCGLQSQVNAVPVLSGHTYYIVVTGYSGGNGAYTLSVEAPPPPSPGDNCADPIVVSLPAALPYLDNNFTCGRGDDYNATCLGFYDGGEDIIYQLNVASEITVSLMLDPLGTTYTGIMIDDACPPDPTTCIAISTMGGSTPHGILAQTLAAGTYYVMIDTWPSPACIPDFNFSIVEALECVVTCPTPSTPEGEPVCYDEYVDVTNGGCNATPNVFGSISGGETVCGTSGTYLFTGLNYRDTDWFLLNVPERSTVTITAVAQFPLQLLYVTGTCASYTYLLATALPCSTATLTQVCNPGDYMVWVGPSVFTGVPCGSPYYVTATFSEPPPPPTPDFTVTAPGSWSDPVLYNTCGAANNCDLRPSEDQIWEVTIPEDGSWTFSLCGTVNTWDSWVGLGTTVCSSNIGLNDDFCGLMSQITANLTAGVYYFTVEGFSSTSCGEYTLDITFVPPCVVTCPPEGIPEGEPDCGDEYVDTYNGGCNSTPPVFQDIAVGDVICGTSGNYLFTGLQYRDTDWFQLTLTEQLLIHWKAVAEFPFYLFIIDGNAGCPGVISAQALGAECDTAEVTYNAQPGTYWLWIGPSVFSGYPCPSDYVAWVTTETPPPAPPNDLCENVTPVTLTPDVPVTFNGDNTGATSGGDCSAFSAYPNVWEAFTIAECMNVTLDYCTTGPLPWGDLWLNLAIGCPCEGFTPAAVYDNTTCGDGNFTLTWSNLAPGTYYYPVMLDPAYNSGPGPYTIHVVGTACPPPPPADFQVTAPGTWTDPVLYNTCGAGNDCNLRTTEEQIFEVTIPTNGTWTFSMCNTNPSWDTWIALGTTSCGGDIATNDDFCGLLSQITSTLTAGVYYLTVEGFSGCGAYTLDITAAPAPPVGLAMTGNVPNVGVSSIGGLGDNTAQGNTWNWNGTGSFDYAGSFVFGNSPSAIWWHYGGNLQETPPRTTVDLDLTDPFHPTAGFDDNDVLGIDVSYCGQGYTDPVGAGDVFLHTYKLTNNGSATVSDVYAAIYMDWDINVADDEVLLDRPNQLVYQHGIGTSVYEGWALVSDSPLRNLSGIAQDVYSYPNSGWLPDSLWNRVSFNGDGIPYVFTDMGSMISTGPYTLAPGAEVTVVFAQIGAASAEDVVARATLARTLVNPCVAAPPGPCDYVVGDINNNGARNGLDVVYGVSYFKGGPFPPYSCECTPGNTWFVAGDVNASCSFNGLDISYLVSYFKGGPVPNPCPSCPPARMLRTPIIEPATKTINNSSGQ